MWRGKRMPKNGELGLLLKFGRLQSGGIHPKGFWSLTDTLAEAEVKCPDQQIEPPTSSIQYLSCDCAGLGKGREGYRGKSRTPFGMRIVTRVC